VMLLAPVMRKMSPLRFAPTYTLPFGLTAVASTRRPASCTPEAVLLASSWARTRVPAALLSE
jgi:hypothetical protein